MSAWIDIVGPVQSRMLLIGDHASNHVPDDTSLGIAPELLSSHIALDIGVASLGRMLCNSLRCPGILGGVSRLVIDFNREEDAPQLIPQESDGHVIGGNRISSIEAKLRINRFWRPYHDRIADQIDLQSPKILISLHSFTPQLATKPDEARPWEIGILYNEDDRAARIAIPLLEASGMIVGDQLPYSGRLLNATMNRHGEANSIAYLGIEMRQDLIDTHEGAAYWAERLAPILETCLNQMTARVETL